MKIALIDQRKYNKEVIDKTIAKYSNVELVYANTYNEGFNKILRELPDLLLVQSDLKEELINNEIDKENLFPLFSKHYDGIYFYLLLQKIDDFPVLFITNKDDSKIINIAEQISRLKIQSTFPKL